jgi:hypothetical protein
MGVLHEPNSCEDRPPALYLLVYIWYPLLQPSSQRLQQGPSPRQSPEASLPSLFPKKILGTDSSLLNARGEGSEVLQNITDQFATLTPHFRIFFSGSKRE